MNCESNKSSSGWARRDFLKTSAAAMLGLTFSRLPAMAGPFTREDFDKLVPADKKLSPEWVKSLFTRGTPEILRGSELKYVGMPVGGIGAGQLYLGGDGRLWHWDIFNRHIATGADHYAKPMTPSSPLAQKFSLKIGDKVLALDREGFGDVSFRGEYPIGIIEYADPAVPLTVKLEAFSPFIPLNTEDSGLPATILEFTMRNAATEPVEATLFGELENGVCLHSRSHAGTLRQRVVKRTGLTTLVFSAEEAISETSPQADAKPDTTPIADAPDYGTMALAIVGDAADEVSPDVSSSFSAKPVGFLGRKLRLAPGESAKVTFIIAWHFPNLSLSGPMRKHGKLGRHYAMRFSSADAVVEYIAKNFSRLETQTKLWRDTWYDSSLPFWFLDRTMLNTSILATSTCFRFADGRFYGWEGVGCCAGTCGHVYHYAHAAARLFPDLERDTRERVDFGLALQSDGSIRFRAECNTIPAIDSQAGTILRALREHQMSVDDTFLKRNWPQIKRATEWLIARDENGDGILEGKQHNTLDSDWYGPVAWLSGLYLASLLGAAQMADIVGDAAFAAQCRQLFDAGRTKLVAELFDGEYFINKVDPKHLSAINSGTGCEIDQVFGQSWAFQVGLPRVLPEKETVAALKSLWRYNFSPDVGPYREANKPGRWYAMAGEAGLLMCTFPRTDWDFAKASGNGNKTFAGYFNECMNGFEYQVAGHMIWEGMVKEGLAVTRAVHDRYHASRRNPWNEVECGDHYARSMASYGVYLAACGFEYDGPKAHIGFAPKLTPENFKGAFTSAEGWGSYSQRADGGKLNAEIAVRWGKLKLKTIGLEVSDAKAVEVLLAGKPLVVMTKQAGRKALLSLNNPVEITAGEKLEIMIS